MSLAPRPATLWAVDDDGRPHLLDRRRKGIWTRSPRTITFEGLRFRIRQATASRPACGRG